MSPETLRQWVGRVEIDAGQRPGLTSDERERPRELERENRELRRQHEILKAASAFFARELDLATADAVRFIDDHKHRFGVEQICRMLQIAPSTYYATRSRSASARAG